MIVPSEILELSTELVQAVIKNITTLYTKPRIYLHVCACVQTHTHTHTQSPAPKQGCFHQTVTPKLNKEVTLICTLA